MAQCARQAATYGGHHRVRGRGGQEEVATPVALASFKHFGNLRRSSVKEVYMINVRYRWGNCKGPFIIFLPGGYFLAKEEQSVRATEVNSLLHFYILEQGKFCS